MTIPMLGFYALAAVSVVSAIMVVANRNPVRSAISLVVNLFVLAVFYVTLSAEYIAVVQVIVYAGAIMVLFLFTIMLLNLGAPEALRERGGLQAPIAALLALIFFGLLLSAGSLGGLVKPVAATAQTLRTGGTVETIGKALFDPAQPWLFPFELTSVILLMGVVGSVILAKRRI
jgi:NADH-quinone oxidoreductase subunit J